MVGRFFGLSEGFKIEAQVEVGITEVIPLTLGNETVSIGLRRLENRLNRSPAGKKVVDLLHRDAGVTLNGYQGLLRLGDASARGTNGAKEMPDRIFDILRVDRLVTFELCFSLFILFGVIIRQTPLPMMRVLLWNESKKGIEVGNGIGDLRLEKALLATSMQGGGSHPHPTALRSNGGRALNDGVVIVFLEGIHYLLRHLGGEVALLSIGAGTQKQTECEE